MQCVSNGDDLKFLLQSKQCHGKLAKSTVGMFAQSVNEYVILQDGKASRFLFSPQPHFSQMTS